MKIIPGQLSLHQLRDVYENKPTLTLDPECYAAIDESRQAVQQVVAAESTVYGINTGFGALAKQRIDTAELQELQRSLVLSHAVGVGELLSDDIVGLILVLKAASLARGFSGIRREIIDALFAMYNQGVYPCIPQKGSVGASGDLAPLAHMAAVLIGEGEVRYQNKILPAQQGLELLGISTFTLEPKEGLALLNGTQVSTALALVGLFAAEDNFSAALVSGAMCVDAALGSVAPFDARIHEVRGHRGQIVVAELIRELLVDSDIHASHKVCDKVQDPYSLRCQPQVMGACLEGLRHAAHSLHIEANAVSDNPLVFADTGDILSGGNFHAEPVAIAADHLAVCIAEIGAITERRIALLIDKDHSGLPAFLVEEAGVNSGFMIAHVTAAALASENKSLAHPASVDSMPTSANQEDHVSMATYAARRLHTMADNTAGIIAIELLAAAQGIELRKPLKTSKQLTEAISLIRGKAAFYDKDRFFAPDIEAVKKLVQQGVFRELIDLKELP